MADAVSLLQNRKSYPCSPVSPYYNSSDAKANLDSNGCPATGIIPGNRNSEWVYIIPISNDLAHLTKSQQYWRLVQATHLSDVPIEVDSQRWNWSWCHGMYIQNSSFHPALTAHPVLVWFRSSQSYAHTSPSLPLQRSRPICLRIIQNRKSNRLTIAQMQRRSYCVISIDG